MLATAPRTGSAPSPALAPPPGNPRFALFDSLRGIAAVAIIVFHVASITAWLEKPVLGDALAVLGPRSLTLFFVISGFLLYRPFVDARASGRVPPRTSRYLRRRVLRIVPAYWVALSLLAVFPGIVGVFSDDWWRFYFFGQLYSGETVGRGIPVAWSLCVEVTFYLLLPLWAAGIARLTVGSRRGWLRGELVALSFAAALGIVVQVMAARNLVSDLVASSLLGQSTWLALGMLLAVLSVAAGRCEGEPRVVRFVARRPGLCWLGAALAFAAITAVLQPGGLAGIVQALTVQQPIAKTLAGIVLTVAMMVLVVLPAVFGEDAGGIPRRLLAAAPIAFLGVISYGLFLWHLTVAQFLALSEDPAHFSAPGLGLIDDIPLAATPVLFLLTLTVTTALAAASHYIVELPFLRLKEGRAHRFTALRRSEEPPG